jgi:fibronectin type 3 domain-containing protein
MAGSDSGRRPRGLAALRRSLRRGDDASGSMVTFIVGTSAFLVSSAVLIHFVAEPPGGTSGLEHADLKARAMSALEILVGTGGYPTDWARNATTVDAMERLGLVEARSSIRVDASKFDAFARGSYLNPSSSNGYVDYAEAREALNLDGYGFHLRVYPLFEPFESSYGVDGMEDFNVAYIGAWSGPLETQASVLERSALAQLDIGFDNVSHTALQSGDAYRDKSTDLRQFLLPKLGSTPDQTVINQGSGTPKYDFKVQEATALAPVLFLEGDLSRGLALSTGTTLGYTKSREIRTTLGVANMTGLLSATLTWNEYVNTSGDSGDYGYVEVSPDGGATWTALTNTALLRSQDTITSPQVPGAWTARSVTINGVNCAACLGDAEVYVAFHWIADSDSTTGTGWIIDDVKLTPSDTTGFEKTFESAHYDLLVVGSEVSQTAFTPAEVKNAIRDYVNLQGGRLIVLGGQVTTQWLEPLFHVGVQDANPGLASPDATHPLLTVPNELDWLNYENYGNAWKFSGKSQEELFNMVVGTGDNEHVLSISGKGAFGSSESDGVVMLTTYVPYTMSEEQMLRFFANTLTYGRYHRLYVEIGPSVPTDVPVASATRSAVMDKTTVGAGDYIEMAFVLYLWKGESSASGSTGTTTLYIPPTTPRNLAAVASSGQVALSWNEPLSGGTGAIEWYNIYRGTTNGSEVFLAKTPLSTNTSFVDLTVLNGVTYYYNITAKSTDGVSASSSHVSATPSGAPPAPQALLAVGGVGANSLSWNAPVSNGGSSITGYRIYSGTSPGVLSLLAEIGSNRTYTHAGLGLSATRYYAVAAVNAAGEGTLSSEATASTLGIPGQPTALVATSTASKKVDLNWVAPIDLGGGTVTYKIYYGTSALAINTLVATTASTSHTHSHTGSAPLNSLTTYYYQVTAVNGAGESARSVTASVLVL